MLDDNSERAAFLLGDMAIHSGDLKKADDIFKSMVWQYPQGAYSNDALMRLDVISLLGDDEASQKYLVRFGEAMRALALGIPLNAATILSDSLFANSPIAEQTAYYSAASFAKAGQNRNAIDIFKKYVERFPDGLYVDRAYLELGDLYIQDPVTYPDAKSAYNKILEAFPESPTTELARDRLRQLESQRKIG
jgi:TolA-binding protein